MRCSNISVSFRIPVPIDKPDGNSTVYTKEAVERGEYYIEGTGRIWNGGTEEIVDVKDDKVLSMQIVGIGIPDK